MPQYVELALVGGDQPCVADAVAKRPRLPHETRRLSRDHNDGAKATWDANDAIDAITATTSSHRDHIKIKFITRPWRRACRGRTTQQRIYLRCGCVSGARARALTGGAALCMCCVYAAGRRREGPPWRKYHTVRRSAGHASCSHEICGPSYRWRDVHQV